VSIATSRARRGLFNAQAVNEVDTACDRAIQRRRRRRRSSRRRKAQRKATNEMDAVQEGEEGQSKGRTEYAHISKRSFAHPCSGLLHKTHIHMYTLRYGYEHFSLNR